jgi:type II secretory pathway pseudopilin PulG
LAIHSTFRPRPDNLGEPRMNIPRNAGFSWVEVIVTLAILSFVAFVILPALYNGIVYRHGYGGTQVLSNTKQLHLATQQMALDGETTGDKSLGWPGDTGGTFTNWMRKLVPAYLGTNDFCKLLSAPGVIVRRDYFPTNMSNRAVVVYAVSSNSAPETVFLTSANFTNSPTGGTPLLKTAKPFGTKGFIVFRKAGDGAILARKQVGDTNLIGAYAPPVK